jgi:hypothetical protein
MSASAGSAIRGGHLRADGQRHREGHRVFSNEESHRIAHGADEIDLVNSGLEETMITAYRQVREQRMRDSGSQICARRRFSTPCTRCRNIPRARDLSMTGDVVV